MNVQPLVSIVIPLFNKSSTVARAIASVKAQTFTNFGCVIVNNNSTDHPNEIVEEAIRGDARFHYVNCSEQGVAHARNYGIDGASGLYIVCLDADDEIKPTFVEVCAQALIEDNSLTIAYTRLEAVAQDGTHHLSDWPGGYSYDQFLLGKNVVPTCCMFRREFWARLGGFRQRYAPKGAGAEDAEFWMRVGAIGGRGKLVTEEALFVYYLGGIVSGDPKYQEVNWREGKPYVESGKHPFASLATPANGKAHLVRQVDEPTVTVVIPCGPGHMQYLWDALDSVLAQSFHRWECIVVYDGDSIPDDDPADRQWERLLEAYPMVRFIYTVRPRSGAGKARNVGASVAKAPLLLFLDADDWLDPDALGLLVQAYAQNPGYIVYCDYLGYAYIEDENDLARFRRANRLVSHDGRSKQTVLRYFAADYDCERAIRQPEEGENPYIWNVISSLVPKQHHLDIGGFDEQMESWEDWDYWIRLARAGKCFTRLPEALLNYRFHTGTRRVAANPGESGEFGRQLSGKLLTYMLDKYKRSKEMPGCRSCGSGGHPPMPPSFVNKSLSNGRVVGMSSEDMVRVQLIDGNVGEHQISFQQVNYGYRSHGDRFLMQRKHAELDPRVLIIEESAPTPVLAEAARPVPPPPMESPMIEQLTSMRARQDAAQASAAEEEKASPKEIVIEPNVYNFSSLWGINEDKATILVQNGVRTLDGLQMLGAERLAKLLDVQDNVAKNILARVQKQTETA